MEIWLLQIPEDRIFQALEALNQKQAGAFLVDAHGVLVEIFERIAFGEEGEEEVEVNG
jgi:hypothetical protein